MDQIILFGDSLFEQSYSQASGFAFGAQFANDYLRRMDVINRGFSGYNTAQALHVLPNIMPDPKCARVRLFVIFFGANDSAPPTYHTNQQIPKAEYIQNLRAIVSHPCVRAQAPQIVIITPPPVDEHQLVERANDGTTITGRDADLTASYARQVTREMWGNESISVLDLWKILSVKAGYRQSTHMTPGKLEIPQSIFLKEALRDGLHFTPLGYKLLYDALTNHINDKIPEMAPGNLDYVFPRWGVAAPINRSREVESDC